VKGRSDYALKLFAWTSGWNIDLRKPEWWRVIQLVEPKTILRWARKKHEVSGMGEEMFATYLHACDVAIQRADSDEYELVRMGHISSPPGTQYFVGQFVFLQKQREGQFEGFVYNNGEAVDLSALKPTKKAGRFRKQGTPTHAMIHDPNDILGKQRREREAIEHRESLRGQVEAKLQHFHEEAMHQAAVRGFISGSPF
jgi:hypothetical protein